MARTIAVFTRSLVPTLRFVSTSFVSAAFCAILASGVLPSGRLAEAIELIGFVGMLIFGLCIVGAVLWMMRFKPVLEITTDGLRDRRISTDIIPWTGIASVTVTDTRRRKTLQLTIDLEVTERMMRTRAQASRMRGRDVSISMKGLSGSFDDLIGALRRIEADTRHRQWS
jgi:hypothetical protein